MRVRVVLVAAAVVALGSAALGGSAGPVEAAPTSVHFTAAGDYSASARAESVLEGVATADPDLHLALGDLSYGTTGSEQAWCDLVTSTVGAGFPFELVSGNHESNGVNGNVNDFSACLPNQLPGAVGTYGRQWYVDVPQQAPVARFVMISPNLTFADGTWSYAAGTPRYNWTAAAIDGARTAGIPWVVVGFHKPCLSLGEYTCESGNALADLMLTKHVDLVLNGHEHLYQRTKQLRLGTGCTTLTLDGYDADCVADSDDAVVQGQGTVFATVGTGGIALRPVDAADPELGYFRSWSGSNATPTWGLLDVQADADSLSAHFVPTSGTFTDAFTITRSTTPPPNQPPTAAIGVPACAALACDFSGTGSTDLDGTVDQYAWTFGDGGTGTGPTPSHTYTMAGSYVVGLTVTDDDGATDTTTRSLVVSDAAAPFASDSFSRTVSSGFGSADVGGAWTVGPVNLGSVSGGVGRLRFNVAGAGPGAYLAGASSTDTDLTMTVSLDKAATGSGAYVWVRGRRVSGAGDYRTRLWWQAGGVLRVSLARTNATSAETAIGPAPVFPGGVSPGDQLKVRMQVTGTNPTTLRAKVWPLGASEPATWTVTGTDSTAALQASGYVGVTTYLSSSATNAPVTVSLDDLTAVQP